MQDIVEDYKSAYHSKMFTPEKDPLEIFVNLDNANLFQLKEYMQAKNNNKNDNYLGRLQPMHRVLLNDLVQILGCS